MRNGSTTSTSQRPRCCGTPLTVVALTRDDGAKSLVELVRCGGCGQSAWRLDGADVAKEVALGALSAAFAPAVPRPAPVRIRNGTRRPTPAAAASSSLVELLSGWQVLGS